MPNVLWMLQQHEQSIINLVNKIKLRPIMQSMAYNLDLKKSSLILWFTNINLHLLMSFEWTCLSWKLYVSRYFFQPLVPFRLCVVVMFLLMTNNAWYCGDSSTFKTSKYVFVCLVQCTINSICGNSRHWTWPMNLGRKIG